MIKKSMRNIPAAAQNELRDRIVLAIEDGMSQADAARTFGVADRSIRRWIANTREHRTEHYVLGTRGRKPGLGAKLTPRQALKIKKAVIGKLPDQLRLPFYLWTRQAVGMLIARELGVGLSLATVGNYLAAWGLTPQRPVRRAYERDDAQIAQWLETDYPKIAAQAKKEKAIIYWADQSGLRSDDVRGRSFALKGQTPEIATTGKRFGLNMISAVSNRGGLAFQIFEGRFDTKRFLGFIARLIKHAKGKKISLIVDRHAVHTSKAIARWVAEHAKQLNLHFLPRYAPELNPDEYLNHDLKLGMSKERPRNVEQMGAVARSHLHKRQKQPQVIRNLFKAKHVRYAA
jgi:transposase